MYSEISNIKKIITWVIAGLLTALFLFSAYSKFATPGQMGAMRLADWGTIIPIGEIISALLFLVPRSNKIGAFLLSSYMGGAIIIHMTGGRSILFPAVVLLLVWAVAFLRNPELCNLNSCCSKKK
jgi:hypothetical protein